MVHIRQPRSDLGLGFDANVAGEFPEPYTLTPPPFTLQCRRASLVPGVGFEVGGLGFVV